MQAYWDLYEGNTLPLLSKSKQGAYKIAWGKLAEITGHELALLDIKTLQDQVNSKASIYYPARDIKTVLKALFTRAIAEQAVTVNLAEYIELPKLDEAEQTPFNEDEQNVLWTAYAACDKFVGYILLMIYTGMIPGELIKAEKTMVDFDAHVISGAGLKTRRRKIVPLVISDVIEPVLRDIVERVPGKKLLRINKDNFYKEFHAALERCGCRPLTPYSCRHTTATALTLKDIPMPVVREVMRHAKITTTERYVHIGVAPMLDAVNKLPGAKDSELPPKPDLAV